MRKIFSLALILSIITFGNTGSIMAQSLTDALNDVNTVVHFSGNKINNEDIDSSHYISENNTTYIDINTIPIQNSIGVWGGIVLASISSDNNISLQQWNTETAVPTFLTFSGDNTSFTGTLYLHPLINTITFTTQNSIIHNINIPNDDPSTKKKMNIRCANIDADKIIIGDNLNIRLFGNSTVNDITIDNNSKLCISNHWKLINSNTEKGIINFTSNNYVEKSNNTDTNGATDVPLPEVNVEINCDG